jgi:hypothetical protein
MNKEVMLPNVDKEIRVVSIDEITQIESSEEVDQETGLLTHDRSRTLVMLKDPNVFVIDSGATIHSTGDSRCLYDMKKTGTFSKVGNGQMVKAAGVGKLKVMACDKRRNELHSLTISDLHVIPGSPFNLLSACRLMERGFKMVGEGQRITFE